MSRLFRSLSNSPINKNIGLLVIRLGIGGSILVFHGYGKMMGGPEKWEWVGGNMSNLGINFMPVFWGFMAAFAEFGCSILIMLGALFRPATAMLAFTMFVGVMTHMNMPADNPNSGLSGASHALELMVVYVGLLLTGPGSYAFRVIAPRHLKKEHRQ